MLNNLINEPLDHRDLANDGLLRNLQGNILKGHGRDNTVHLIIWFDSDQTESVKQFIAEFAQQRVTSFKEQLRQREVYKRNGISDGLFTGLYLTSQFYTDFGFDVSGFKNGEAFLDGLKKRKDKLQDNYFDKDTRPLVEKAYMIADNDENSEERKPIHAMILLAHTDIIELNKATNEVCEALDNFNRDESTIHSIGKVLTIEYGSAIRNANGDGLEHFGYVDGISQPLFLKEDIEAYNNSNIQPLRFDPSAFLDLVLVTDPLALPEDNGIAYGSYFVFRKLEQNVRGFKKAEDALGDTLGLTPDDKERAGAMIVGRFEDGTPVTLSKEDKMISSGIMNNFDYTEVIKNNADDSGARCPFHGHIRKTNPRGAQDLDHRMARRGITYGHRNVSTTVEQNFVQMPFDGVGLLFMSFQSNLQNQFEYIQKQANSNDFSGHPKTGVDLIIGPAEGNRICNYAKTYNETKSIESQGPFANFTTFRGGEYFFAPSLSFLKKHQCGLNFETLANSLI